MTRTRLRAAAAAAAALLALAASPARADNPFAAIFSSGSATYDQFAANGTVNSAAHWVCNNSGMGCSTALLGDVQQQLQSATGAGQSMQQALQGVASKMMSQSQGSGTTPQATSGTTPQAGGATPSAGTGQAAAGAPTSGTPTSGTPASGTGTTVPQGTGSPAGATTGSGASTTTSPTGGATPSGTSNSVTTTTPSTGGSSATPSGSGASCGSGSTMFDTMASCLSSPQACWSCELYESVFFGMRQIVTASYQYFVGTDSSGGTSTAGALSLATTILMIAVLVKVVPIAIGTASPAESGAKLRMFLLRVTIVFGAFLTTAAATGVANPTLSGGTASDPGINLGIDDTSQGSAGSSSGTATTNSQANPASDWFIDGPLALGTQIATDLAGVAAQALSSSSGSGGTSGSSSSSVMTGASITNSSGAGNNTFATLHVTAAKSMLLNLHQLGVAGLITGLWMALQGATTQMGSNIMTSIACVAVGIMLAWLFFMFTVTFGLRYIDALIRSMMIFSLTPVIVFLWIFDSTRDIAMKAFKAGVALAAVFAVSGVVFTTACFILGLGFNKAFNQGGSGLNTQALGSALSQIKGGGFSFLIGNSGSASTLNWLSLCYLAGSASLAISCSQMAFTLASSLFAVGQAELGIGREVAGEIEGAASQAKNFGLQKIGGMV